jgi:GNAT superfamily N-acetyltransferase
MNVILHDLVGGNVARLDALLAIFAECFPQYAAVAPRLAQKALRPASANPHFIAHQWLAEVDGQAAGMFSFKYAPGRDLGLAIYLAVRPAWRSLCMDGLPLSAWLIQSGLRQLTADAAAAGRLVPAGFFFEVEPDRLVARYREFGFVELPVEYYEPHYAQPRSGPSEPTDADRVAFRRTHFGVFPVGGAPDNPTGPGVVTRAVLAFMVDHYGLPETHWAVARAVASIACPAFPGIVCPPVPGIVKAKRREGTAT